MVVQIVSLQRIRLRMQRQLQVLPLCRIIITQL